MLPADKNNQYYRRKRDNIIYTVMDQVVEMMWRIRYFDPGWSDREHYAALPAHQKIWLDQKNAGKRETPEDDWLDKVIESFARWIIFAYNKLHGRAAVFLGDDELKAFKRVIEDNKEMLR